MKKKLVSFAAVVVVAGAIGAAPASAAAPSVPAIPDAASLAALCTSVPQPSLQAACNQVVAKIGACASAGNTKALVSCLRTALGGLKPPRVGGLGGFKLPSLSGLSGLSGLGGLKLPAGLDLSKLLGGLKR